MPSKADLVRKKAVASYGAAQMLLDSDCNSAANRAYYAVYQAVVGELESQGHVPESIDSVARENAASKDPTKTERPERWRHSFLQRHEIFVSLLKGESDERELLKQAYSLRCKADYQTDSVYRDELEAILDEMPALLANFGVKV